MSLRSMVQVRECQGTELKVDTEFSWDKTSIAAKSLKMAGTSCLAPRPDNYMATVPCTQRSPMKRSQGQMMTIWADLDAEHGSLMQSAVRGRVRIVIITHRQLELLGRYIIEQSNCRTTVASETKEEVIIPWKLPKTARYFDTRG